MVFFSSEDGARREAIIKGRSIVTWFKLDILLQNILVWLHCRKCSLKLKTSNLWWQTFYLPVHVVYMWEIRWWQMIWIGIISSVSRVSWWTWLASYFVLPTSHLLKYSFWCFREWKLVPVELAFRKAWLRNNQARRWWWCFNLYPWWAWNDVIHTIILQLSLSNLFRLV